MSEDAAAIEQMATTLNRPDLVCQPGQGEIQPPAIAAVPAIQPPPDPLSGYPPLVSLADWNDHEPIPDELVHGVLHRGSKMILGGGSKSFKTWVLMALAIAVAAGRRWLGFPCRRGRVLYLNFELAPAFCQSRLRAITQDQELQFADLPNLEIWNLRGFATSATSFFDAITGRLEDEDYSLIVVDPIYKLLGGRVENSAEDVAAVLNAIERLAVDTGAAVAFGHHFSKGNQAGKESIDRVSGSGVWARDPDSLIMLTRHEEENSYSVELTLRNHRPVESFVVQWDFPVMVRRDDLNASQLRQPGRTRQYTPDQALAVLVSSGTGGLRSGEWREACENDLGISASTFYNLRRQLVHEERVMQGPTGYVPVRPLGDQQSSPDEEDLPPETPESTN